MNRKLIQQSSTSMGISLPKKWLDKNRLNKGDPIEITEQSTGELLIGAKNIKPTAVKKYSIDVSGMNAYQIKRMIRGFYRSKIDEITITFKDHIVVDPKSKKKISIYDLCEEVSRKLIGLEIISKENNKLVLQCFLSKDEEQSIQAVEKRIFFMIKDLMDKILSNISNASDLEKISVEDHDKIAKFCEYYMRAVVYSQMPDDVKAANYSLINMLDKLSDLLRYLCHELEVGKPTPKVESYLKELFSLFDLYYKFFYAINDVDSKLVTEKRYALAHKLRDEKFTLGEYKIVSEALFILHLMNDFHETKRIRMLA